jgi:hypothetical protein
LLLFSFLSLFLLELDALLSSAALPDFEALELVVVSDLPLLDLLPCELELPLVPVADSLDDPVESVVSLLELVDGVAVAFECEWLELGLLDDDDDGVAELRAAAALAEGEAFGVALAEAVADAVALGVAEAAGVAVPIGVAFGDAPGVAEAFVCALTPAGGAVWF